MLTQAKAVCTLLSVLTRKPKEFINSMAISCQALFLSKYKRGEVVTMSEWTTIKNFHDYEINKQGDIRRKDNKVIFSKVYDKDGYLKTALRRDGKRYYRRVHRLVAKTFLPNPNNLSQVNHINGIRDDNRVENLEWVSAKENVRHAYDVLGRKGHNGGMNKVVEKIDPATGEVLQIYNSVREALIDLGAKSNTITHVLNGRNKTALGFIWREIEKV